MVSDIIAYERFIYTLQDRYPAIELSTLIIIRLEVWGDLDLAGGVIQWYSYAVNHGAERLYWYDSQPHPHNPELASNHPHHKHVPPDIKRNRIPALTSASNIPIFPC